MNTTEQTNPYYDALNGMYSNNQISQVEGKSTSSMQTQSTFANWDFTTIWQILGTAYPTFQNPNLTTTNFTENNSFFKVYPNPTTDFIYIENSENLQINSIKIFDLNGKAVFDNKNEKTVAKIDVSFLSKGIYMLTINTEYGLKSIKFIKKL